jgi:hypothetical protein
MKLPAYFAYPDLEDRLANMLRAPTAEASRFRWPPPRTPIPQTTLLDRIAPMRSALLLSRVLPMPPLGWCWRREQDRHGYRLMPLWLDWLLELRFWRWWLFAPLLRWGWLEAPHDGCYFHELRPRGWRAWWTPEREASWHYTKTGEWP